MLFNCTRLNCTDGLTGDIKRECGENGIWKLPNYDCISQKLLNIQNEVSIKIYHMWVIYDICVNGRIYLIQG